MRRQGAKDEEEKKYKMKTMAQIVIGKGLEYA